MPGRCITCIRERCRKPNGQILKVEEQSIYFGGGDWTVGSQTVAIPGRADFAHVGDAYFAQLVAAQVVASRTATSRAVENANLLDITDRYLALVAAGRRAVRDPKIEEGLMQIVRATDAFARTGQGRVGDAKPGSHAALLLRSHELQAQENLAVASAELSSYADLDPSVRLRTAAGMIEVVQLVDPGYRVEELVRWPSGRVRKQRARPPTSLPLTIGCEPEYARPWLPVISVGFSAGGFGGGGNQGGDGALFQNTGGRTDFDVFAV